MRLSDEHIKRLKDVLGSIRITPCDESSFLRLELLFYDVLSIARAYGDEWEANNMLAALKHIQAREYKHANEKFPKSRQRMVAIKKFRTALKKEVSFWTKLE
jgi:predicted DNA-binding ribbon-helix-helix protein